MTYHYEQPSRAKMISHDLLRILVHECGHLIVGDNVGVEKSFARFWLYDDADPAQDRLIGGQTEYFPPLNGRDKQLMGVAGYVAEMLANDEMADIHDEDLIDYWDCDAPYLSATDLEAAGEVDEALFYDCGKLLRRHWPDLIDEALHFLGQFKEGHADDEDAAEAAASVHGQLEGMRGRFSDLPQRQPGNKAA